jgi:hypothetical protein
MEELSRQLMRTIQSGGDFRALLPDVEFQQITDRNSQMLFLRRFVVHEYLVSINNKMLADKYGISVRNLQKICRVSARRREAEVGRVGRPLP